MRALLKLVMIALIFALSYQYVKTAHPDVLRDMKTATMRDRKSVV